MKRGRTTILQECVSTNTEATNGDKYFHGDAVVAVRQTGGRGQRGHKWESAEGENLTFSMVFQPTFLPVPRQFMLSEAVALAVADTLSDYGIEAKIKWTNDIYVADRKICGILLEHSIEEGHLSRTVAGVGLNVNQLEFAGWVSNPCSMASLTGRRYDVLEVFGRLYENLANRYDMLERGCGEEIGSDYHSRLYRLGRPSRFFIPDRGEVEGTITGVGPDGTLYVGMEGSVQGFLFREIEFII